MFINDSFLVLDLEFVRVFTWKFDDNIALLLFHGGLSWRKVGIEVVGTCSLSLTQEDSFFHRREICFRFVRDCTLLAVVVKFTLWLWFVWLLFISLQFKKNWWIELGSMFYVDFELALVVTFGSTETDVIVNLDIDSKTWEDILFARAKPKEEIMEFSGENFCILKSWRIKDFLPWQKLRRK